MAGIPNGTPPLNLLSVPPALLRAARDLRQVQAEKGSRDPRTYQWQRNRVLRGAVHRDYGKGELWEGVGVGRPRVLGDRSRLGTGLCWDLPWEGS